MTKFNSTMTIKLSAFDNPNFELSLKTDETTGYFWEFV